MFTQEKARDTTRYVIIVFILHFSFADSLSNLDDSNFEKKVVKIYKAMRIMEQAKHLEPKFSESIKELSKYISEQRVSSFKFNCLNVLSIL